MVSVVMPIYNGEQYLKECMDSVLSLTYTNFEFVIVDDGSTDSSADIINSYNDSRIKYYKCEHHGISCALNYGIKMALYDLICRMDCDDIMYADRIEYQIGFMLSHENVDILGCGFEWGNGNQLKEYFTPNSMNVCILDFSNGNIIGHSTVMMRKSSLQKLPFIYQSLYDGLEDLKLWLTALSHGLIIHNEPRCVIYYRLHEQRDNANEIYNTALNICNKMYNNRNNRDAMITAIIPFLNERDEIERTVENIRLYADNVNIMLINDCSDDGYDYEIVSRIFGCDYYYNDENKGVAKSRDFGVEHCNTTFFVLLDGHMRFYDYGWEKQVIELLLERSDRLITSDTIVINKDDNGIYKNENGAKGVSKVYAAFANMDEVGWEFSAKWAYKEPKRKISENIYEIPVVLGAFYASSVSHWKHIGGLEGLIKYGYDEPLMSIKTWLSGGQVLLIKGFGVGHLYRTQATYFASSTYSDHNLLYIVHIFVPSELIHDYECNIKQRIGTKEFKDAKHELILHYTEVLQFRNHFWNDIAIHKLDFFFEINKLP